MDKLIYNGNTADFRKFARAGITSGNYNERALKYLNYLNGDTSRSLATAIKKAQSSGVENVFNLFSNGEQGAWYEPSDLTTLYQDSAGTTPVTADGDPVGLMLDKSGNGNHASQPTSASRPVYRTAAGLHWLEPDGVDDRLGPISFPFVQPYSFFVAAKSDVPTESRFIVDGASVNSSSIVNLTNGTIRAYAGKSAISTAVIDSNPHVLSAVFNGVNSIVGVDTIEALRDAGISSANGLTIFDGSDNAAAINWDGRFYGGIFVKGARSLVERQAARAYLAAKSGVTL